MSRTNYLRPLVLLMAAAVAVGVLMVLGFALPVQAQSESADNDTADAPAQSESIDNGTGDEPQPTGKHLIVFGDTDTLPSDYERRIADLGGTVEDQYPEIGVVVASGLSEEAVESLKSDEDVKEVEQDAEIQWLDPSQQPSVEEASAEGTSVEVEPASQIAPNTAFFYPRQWNMRTIHANDAWSAGQLGSPNVTVAILDTGIDPTYPDLAGLVDTDTTRSVSFVPSDDALVKSRFPGRNPITDLNFHGTHVAATVSSKAFVAAGVTSRVKLMAVKVFGWNGSGPISTVLAGIMQASDQGADVINMSLEAYFHKRNSPGAVEAYNRAVNHAHEKGAVIVVAAGNKDRDLARDSDGYQAFCQSPHVICVSATGPASSGGVNGPWSALDTRAPYSNYGPPITVAAPGGTGTSAPGSINRGGFVLAACSTTSLVVPACQSGINVISLNGTSQAAPHVAGLAALLVDKIGKDRPSEVARQIRASADDLGDPKKDAYYGHGRIDVAKALGLK